MNAIKMLGGAALAAAVALGASGAARAACTAEQGQQVFKIRKEMEGQYLNKKWEALDASYARLEQTTCTLLDVDHDYGARGASGRGDVGSALTRWRRLKNGVGTASIIADLEARFGAVAIEATPGTKVVRTGGPSLRADAVTALDFVAKRLDLKGGLDGYLPLGTYDVGTAHFEVKAGARVVVTFTPKAGWQVRPG